MTPKIPSTTMSSTEHSEIPAAAHADVADFAAQWNQALLAYPLYAALATRFGLAPLPYPPGELPPARPTRSAFDSDLQWLDALDGKLLAFQIRQLPPEILNASEESLREFVRRQLRKADKTDADRDKIDFLLVQYFALCASGDLVRTEITLEDVAQVLRPVISEADPTPLEWCKPLDQILEKARNCQSLRDLMEEGLLEQGRLLKDSAGCMFYDPAALVAFARFNFLLRRTFIRTLHADLSAVREAIDSIESRGIKTVDCRRAGFSAAETAVQLRYFCENWRQPFQKDYTQNSVSHAFEQLLALRADLEEALGIKRMSGKPASPPVLGEQLNAPVATPGESNAAFVSAPAPAAGDGGAPQPAAAKDLKARAHDNPALHAAECLEEIRKQLIAVPASRAGSMSTVILQDTKVMLSSWEVAAFVGEGGQDFQDLRRAVVARALLALGSDKRKRSGDESALASALVLARTEVSYFQGRVEQAKRAKNIEAAVNLGISTKRLLSSMEEAEKLQP